MDERGDLLARILDAGLAAFAAGTAVRQRELLREQGLELLPGFFEDLLADTEVRIRQLAAALATGEAALFVEEIEWARSSRAARGVSEEVLATNLTCLRRELESELPRQGREAPLAMIDAALARFESPPRPVPTLLEGDLPHRGLVRRLLLALLEGRRHDAIALVLNAADEGVPVSELETGVIAPVLREVGSLWQRGELRVHEEHLGSRIVEEALILLHEKSRARPQRGKTILIASVHGDLHDIGTRIISDHFEMDGWNALRLGASLPAADLAQASLDFGADLLAVSVTLTTHVREAAAMIAELRRLRGAELPPVLVGGPPFVKAAELWRAVGADGTASDAVSAVREGCELLRLPAR